MLRFKAELMGVRTVAPLPQVLTTITAVQLLRDFSAVRSQAQEGPVAIATFGIADVVVLSSSEYASLVAKQVERRQ